MRIMGLDFGSKTVGVAISDALLITAQGIEIIRRNSENKLRQTLARIEELIVEYEVQELVLGLPKNMNNTQGERVEKTLEFKEMLDIKRIRKDKEAVLKELEKRIEPLAKKQKTIRTSQKLGLVFNDPEQIINILDTIEPILYEGKEIVPLQFLKAVLPDPASLGPRTIGKTNIGCIFKGIKDGALKTYYIYNICDHQECYKEVGSQAISYTTGVPAMIGAMMIMNDTWKGAGVYNIEEFDPDPFMDALNQWGLPWEEDRNPTLVD